MNLNTPGQFKTKKALIIMSVLGLLLAYGMASKAIDTGSWWQYLATVVIFVLSIRLFVKALKNER